MEAWTVRLWRAVFVLAGLLFWEATSRSGWVDPDLLPPLSKVLRTTAGLLSDSGFLSDIRVTVVECIVAFAVVAPLGLLVGIAMGESRRLERTLGPSLQLLMTVPKSIFLPVFILVLGIGFFEKIVFSVVLTFFIVVPTGIAAVHSVPKGLVTVAEAYGATRKQIMARIYVPAALPIVLSGVRLALIFAVHGVIFAEMYASSEGVGRSILNWGESFEMDKLFAGVLLIVVFTVALNESMQALETLSRRRFGAADPI